MDARFQRLFFRATSQFFQQSALTVAALSRLVTMFAEIKLPEYLVILYYYCPDRDRHRGRGMPTRICSQACRRRSPLQPPNSWRQSRTVAVPHLTPCSC